jgi:hypothetical protein
MPDNFRNRASYRRKPVSSFESIVLPQKVKGDGWIPACAGMTPPINADITDII